MKAAQLNKYAAFQQPTKGRDEDGQIITAYPDTLTVWCNVKPLRGGEAVMQARMQSRSPAILTVRSSPETRQINSEWRAVIDGRTYEIKEDWRETDDRAFLEMLAEGRA